MAMVNWIELMDAEEASDLLRLKPSTLASWRWRGIGPSYIKCGHRVLYDRADLLQWANSNRVSTQDLGGVQ
jgi:hypothetical protein